jgi:hypothetical protein
MIMLLYRSESWELTKEKMETTEMCFLRGIAGYRMTDHESKADVEEEL